MRSSATLVILFGLLSFGHLPECRAGERLPGIVFVSDDIFGPKHEKEGIPRPGTNHWREGYIYHRATTQIPLERSTTPTRPGSNLYTLVPPRPDGKLTRITHLTDGEVFDPEPSHDGTKILFAMRRDGEDWFNLYEINVDGTGLVQLTDGPFNDVSGVYLADDRIVFVSDRTGYLEEYHEERTETLWAMRGDGTGIEQLTFNPGTVFDPTVLSDGRVLFSIWDTFMLNIPGPDKHETYLMTIRPDGTEESHFFGIRQYRFFNRERHSGFALTQAGQMPDGTILVQSEMGPSILDPGRGMETARALWPIFPGTTSLQLGGATHRVHLSPTGSRITPYPLPDGRVLLSATLPGARDIAIYICDPKTREMRLVYNDPTTSEFDARPIMLARPRPTVLPPKAGFAGAGANRGGQRVRVTGRARFLVTRAERSDNAEHERAMRDARYLRVVEALHSVVTTSSHTSLATRILGVVPILSDGSAYFEAPADTPLFLEPLDAALHRLPYRWNYPVSSLPPGSRQTVQEMSYISARPGEVKACNGCHAPQEAATTFQDGFMAALEHRPVRVERDLTDIIYRRNEPDEYRCQARIGEAPKYRPWLSSPDPVLRRWACELLMEIEDGGRATEPEIVGLLDDESVDVRRAAALALTRLGSVKSVPALVEALSDPDWQVRFHAASALEVIAARAPPERSNADSARSFYSKLLARSGGVEGLKSAIGRAADAPTGRWFEAVGRLGPAAPESARLVVRRALDVPTGPPPRFEPRPGKRYALEGKPPELAAIRAAGWARDAASARLLIPWLARHEYEDHATESAVGLGRIGTPEAVEALWEALRLDVPNKRPYLSRYLQRGPRPEEYALLRGLILARAVSRMDDIHLLIGLLPGSFLEKPRFEDRARPESQRVLLARLLLEQAGLRAKAVGLLIAVLRGDPPPEDDPLYAQIVKGINLERPFAEHGRRFPLVERIEPEQALWLLGCLATDRSEAPDELIRPYLSSENWRERIDGTVLLHLWGFGPETAERLAAEALRPYAFKEIVSIGKGVPDTNFRDKCYLVMALAHHVEDVERLRPFADPKTRYRDIRYGLALGLGYRGKADGIGLLSKLATSDPISAIRCQARASLRAIQDRQRVAGVPISRIRLPKPLPFEMHYPPRGLRWPGATGILPVGRQSGATGVSPVQGWKHGQDARDTQPTLEELLAVIEEGLRPEHYRNLNNGNNQAPGASRMMISGTDSLDRAVAAVSARHAESAGPLLRRLLDSPYPTAQYLALRELSRDGHAELDALLIAKLPTYRKSDETVGFFWTCEALARRGTVAALPVLVELAWADYPPDLHGPIGMGHGYPAAKAIARLARRIDHAEVQRLLSSENIWLRAGALAGLTEVAAPGVEELLSSVSRHQQAAVVRSEAAVGTARLKPETVRTGL